MARTSSSEENLGVTRLIDRHCDDNNRLRQWWHYRVTDLSLAPHSYEPNDSGAVPVWKKGDPIIPDGPMGDHIYEGFHYHGHPYHTYAFRSVPTTGVVHEVEGVVCTEYGMNDQMAKALVSTLWYGRTHVEPVLDLECALQNIHFRKFYIEHGDRPNFRYINPNLVVI